MKKSEQSELFYGSFVRGLYSEQDRLFSNPKTLRVLVNLAEFLIKEKKFGLEGSSTLLGMALKVPQVSHGVDFARVLYIFGYIFGKEKMYIRGEGLFSNAKQMLEEKSCYERVEMYYLFGNMLNQIDTRKKEGQELIEKGRKAAELLPVWHPYLVNLFVPDLELN